MWDCYIDTGDDDDDNDDDGGDDDDGDDNDYIGDDDDDVSFHIYHMIGGNAKTLIILTVSSLRSQLAESISTLRFGIHTWWW